MSNLYTFKNTKKGISIYKQVCNPINKNFINNYLKNDKKIQKVGEIILEINYSCMILLTKKELPRKLKNLKYKESPLFVADFKNKNYFWLCN